MYNSWFVTEIGKERHREFLEAAERERMLRRLPAPRPTWPARLRDGLADGLIALGHYLQARQGDTAAPTALNHRPSHR